MRWRRHTPAPTPDVLALELRAQNLIDELHAIIAILTEQLRSAREQ